MEIREYQENEMNIKEIWVNNVMVGKEEWPIVTIEPQHYQPTNAEVAQMISDLQADLIIAGVI